MILVTFERRFTVDFDYVIVKRCFLTNSIIEGQFFMTNFDYIILEGCFIDLIGCFMIKFGCDSVKSFFLSYLIMLVSKT